MSRVHWALGVAVTVAVGGLVLSPACGGKTDSTAPGLATDARGTAPQAAEPASTQAAAAVKATVATAGGTTTVKGVGPDKTAVLKLGLGAYTIHWTSPDPMLTVTVVNAAGETKGVYASLFAKTDTDLLAVDGSDVSPSDVALDISGEGAWTVELKKADAAAAAALPQVLKGEELTSTISPPFSAASGSLTVKYTFKSEATGTGTLTVLDVATGKPLEVRDMMYAGRASGSFSVPVPTAGAFIAKASFPLKSGGGEVTISQ